METSWRFRGVRYGDATRTSRGGSAWLPSAYLLALTRPRRVRFLAFTLAR